MKSRTWTLGSIFSLVFVLLIATATVHAAPIIVNCSKGGSISSTLASLAKDGNTRGITISVSGTCKENIVIRAFDHLVLQAASIATTLQDASNGTAPVVEVLSSYDVTVQGFEINGGAVGVVCWYFSFCTLNLNTVQQSNGEGVFLGRSDGLLQGNKIVNNAAHGVTVNASKLETYGNTISNNGASGVIVNSGNLTATSDTITSNGVFGIRLLNNSVMRAFDLTIDGNSAAGIHLESQSTASFEQINTGNVITGNGGNGVSVNDLSFASFSDANNISGNLTQPDVACNPQYSATRGAGTVGGTTNCVEPLHKK